MSQSHSQKRHMKRLLSCFLFPNTHLFIKWIVCWQLFWGPCTIISRVISYVCMARDAQLHTSASRHSLGNYCCSVTPVWLPQHLLSISPGIDWQLPHLHHSRWAPAFYVAAAYVLDLPLSCSVELFWLLAPGWHPFPLWLPPSSLSSMRSNESINSIEPMPLCKALIYSQVFGHLLVKCVDKILQKWPKMWTSRFVQSRLFKSGKLVRACPIGQQEILINLSHSQSQPCMEATPWLPCNIFFIVRNNRNHQISVSGFRREATWWF